MKKYSLLLVISILSSYAFCQLNKKQFIVGGNADFTYSGQSGSYNGYSQDNKITELIGSADAGYFVIERLCAGLRFSTSITNIKENSTSTNYQLGYNGAVVDTIVTKTMSKSTNKATGFGFSPFVRYYFLPITNKINLLCDVSYIYAIEKSSVSNSNFSSAYTGNLSSGISGIASYSEYSATAHTNAFAFQAGPVLFLNERVSLELLVGYEFYQYDHLNSNSLTVGAGLHAHLRNKMTK